MFFRCRHFLLESLGNHSREPLYWFVLRITYQRERAVKLQLDRLGIENFVPMQRVRRRNAQGRFYYSVEAALHNYVFVHATHSEIATIKRDTIPDLRYVMRNVDGLRRIMTVPEEQMRSFIAVAGNPDEHVLFLPPQELDFSKGQRVRILGGPFEGVEGIFMRVSNKHEKRVVVQIAGLVAVATTTIPAVLVEKV